MTATAIDTLHADRAALLEIGAQLSDAQWQAGYTHIRADLFAPHGPLPGPSPRSDAARFGPVLDWIEAALPQQNAASLCALSGTLQITVTSGSNRVIRLGQGEPVARISSDAAAFVRWVTQRGSWAELDVQATGDEAQLAIARSLHVF